MNDRPDARATRRKDRDIPVLWPLVLSSADRLTLRTEALVAEPVSYTHLRAHETVLDLVCRLLLEKKKKYSTTPLHHSTNNQQIET